MNVYELLSASRCAIHAIVELIQFKSLESEAG